MNNTLFIQNSIHEYFVELKKQLYQLENVLNEIESNMIFFTEKLNASTFQEFINSLMYFKDFVNDYVSNENTVNVILSSVIIDTINILDPLIIIHRVDLSNIEWGTIKKIQDTYGSNKFIDLQNYLLKNTIDDQNYLVDTLEINSINLIELLKVFLEQINLTGNFLSSFRKFLLEQKNFKELICYIYPNKFWERLIIDVLNKYKYNLSQINFLFSSFLFINVIITDYKFYEDMKKDLFDIICLYKLERVFSMLELSEKLQKFLIKIRFPFMMRKRVLELCSIIIESNDESLGTLFFNKLFLATECFYCYEVVPINEMHYHLSKNENSRIIENITKTHSSPSSSYTFYDFIGCFSCYNKRNALHKLDCFTCHIEIYRRDIPITRETIKQHLNQLKVIGILFVDGIIANTNPVKLMYELINSPEYLDDMTVLYAKQWKRRLTFTPDPKAYLAPMIQEKLDKISDNFLCDEICLKSRQRIDNYRVHTELELMCPRIMYTNNSGKSLYKIKKDTPLYKHIENEIKNIQKKIDKIYTLKKSSTPDKIYNVAQFKSELFQQKQSLLNIKQSIFDKFITYMSWSKKEINEFKFSMFPGLDIDLPIIIPKYKPKEKKNDNKLKNKVEIVDLNERNIIREKNIRHDRPTRKAKLEAKERIKRIYR